MKKILMLFAAAALVLGAASCQKENFQKALAEGQEKIDYSDDPMGVIKVYIKKDDTKMGFEEKNNALYRSWEKDDVIDGCTKVDDKFVAFAYTVDEVGTDEHGQFVKLIKTSDTPGVPSSAKGTQINFVYAPGAVSFDETTGACSLDLSKQEEGAIPAVMVASGTVDKDEKGDPKLSLKFNNIAAVMAIRDGITLKDVNNTEVTGYTINKVYAIARTKGTLTLNNDEYKISDATPDDFWPTTISPKDGEGPFSADDPIYLAALPGEGKISAELRTDKGKFVWETSSAQNLGANAYARIKTKTYNQRAEAEIGDKRYAIEDAFAYAQTADDNVTITMVEDAVTYEEIKFTQEKGKKITLDLNDKTITSKNLTGEGRVFNTKVTDNDPKFPFEVKNGTITGGLCSIHTENDLTLTDAKFYANGKNASAVINVNNSAAKVDMKRCYVKATATEAWAGNWENIRAVNVGGPTTIENCTLISPAIALRVFNASSKNTVEVKNSECISDGNACTIYANSARPIDIESGYFYNGSKEIIGNKDGVNPIVNISGGYFNKEVIAAPGYKCIEDETTYGGKTYTHKIIESYNAKIGETQYRTLAEAVAAANEAGTAEITILDDCSAPAQTIEVGKNITLDLNGKTVTAPITVKGEFTLNDGDNTQNIGILQISESDKITVSVADGATFTLNGGTVIGSPDNSGSDYSTIKASATSSTKKAKLCIKGGKVITNSSYGSVYGKYAEIEISNCEIIADKAGNDGSVRAFFLTTGSTVKISKSKITSDTHVFHFGAASAEVELNEGSTYKAGVGIFNLNTAAGTIVVNDGYFDTSSDGSSLFIKEDNLKNTMVKGGYYVAEPNENSVPSGFTVVELEEPVEHDGVTYTYKVNKSADPVIQIGDTEYDNVDNAMDVANKATDPVTIKLLQDIDMQKSLAVTNATAKVTMDLNTHSITFRDAAYNISISDNVKIEIKNGSIDQTKNGSSGGIETYSKAIVNNGGDLTLTDVKITGIKTSSYSVAVYQPVGNLVVCGQSEITAAKCIQAGMNGGSGSSVTVNGGSITSIYSGTGTDSNSGFCISGTYGATIVVNDGNLKAEYTGTTANAGQVAIYCRYTGSTTEITGGTVTADHNYAIYAYGCESVTVSGGTVQSTGQIGIYANNKSELNVSGEADISSTTNSGISVNGAKLNVKGGIIYSTASHGIYSYGSSTVDISGGEIYSSGTESGRGFYVYTGTTATISGGYIHSKASQAIYTTRNQSSDPKPNLTITGGTFETEAEGIAAIYIYTIGPDGASISQAENSKTIVKSHNGPALQLRNNASLSILNVSGGYFSGKESAVTVASPGKLTISGGYYTSDVSSYVAAGKSCTAEGGPWTNGTDDGIAYSHIVK